MDPMFDTTEDIIIESEEVRTTTYKSKNGDNYTFKCTDPFGFWHIKAEGFSLPQNLTGSYTSVPECEKAVEACERHVEPVSEVVKIPEPIKRKPVKKI